MAEIVGRLLITLIKNYIHGAVKSAKASDKFCFSNRANPAPISTRTARENYQGQKALS